MDSRIISDSDEYEESNIHWLRALIISIIIPLAIGFLTYLYAGNAMKAFDTMNKPALAPPAYLFSIAWTILYVLMGIGAYAIYTSRKEGKTMLLFIYGVHLFFNAIWTPLFFIAKAYWFSFAWLMIMLLMVFYITIKSVKYSKLATFCFVPYAAWCVFAAYLNAGIAMLN